MTWRTGPMPEAPLDTDPYYMTPEQERAAEEKEAAEQDALREQLAGIFEDFRGELYLHDVRRIVIEELNKLKPLAGEPEWQTRTPVPIPKMG